MKVEPPQATPLCDAILDASPDPILLVGADGNIVRASARVEPVLGWRPDELVGQSIEVLVPKELRPAHVALRDSYVHRPRVRDMGVQQHLKAVRKDGTLIPTEISLSPLKIEGQTLVVAIIRDVTERRAIERKLQYMSTHDSLTGVYNRTFFQTELERLDRGRGPTSVLMIDVDGLKTVNDGSGHAAGDLLLKRTAAALRTAFRTEDVVARIGGDEFAVLLPGVDADGLKDAVRRLLEDVGRMNEVHGGRPVLFSLGGGTATSPGMLAATLRSADVRMYREKQKRKELQPA